MFVQTCFDPRASSRPSNSNGVHLHRDWDRQQHETIPSQNCSKKVSPCSVDCRLNAAVYAACDGVFSTGSNMILKVCEMEPCGR